MRKVPIYEKGGVISELGAEYCTVRLRIPAGLITLDQMEGVVTIARKYQADVHLTTRQTMELVHVDPVKLESLVSDLAENGTPIGAEKAEIVNITACPGTERCRYAMVDSISLAKTLDEKFFGKEMPVKFRIAVSSCPNSCVSERLNEIGITGVVRPYRVPGTCTGCGTCVQYCKEKAIVIKNGQIVLDEGKCVHCGMCIQSCPFHIIKSEPAAYHITIGGKRGRHPRVGYHVVTVKTPETVVKVVELVVKWVYRKAWSDSLLPDQLDILDFESFKKELVAGLDEEEMVTGY
ncbi:4Fe-4S dicluster domain-containing protein [Methanospirillum stamsii]|uniref:Nitrite reductase n=1 Tax=Methanospirillum stamsii TaxID=1277351 RepID=A0A2V2NBA9_9EURY|nr:4Fe-4S dicluster domain-containing protein [Methanospirillum stamsii]PWR76030.1 nitrite reductase [Methanospirillum stamsii]